MGSSHHHGSRMRFGGSSIIFVLLCLVTVVLLYFYWSLGGQLKVARGKVVTLKESIRLMEDEKEKFSNRLSVLTEDVKRENRAKRDTETKARAMKVQLDEAQMKLQSADARVTEFQSRVESIQEQLNTKTDENEQLAQQIMEKDSKIEDCVKEKELLSSQFNDLHADVQSSKGSMEKQVGDIQKQMDYVNSELRSEQSKSQMLQQQLSDCKNSFGNRANFQGQPPQQPNYQQPQQFNRGDGPQNPQSQFGNIPSQPTRQEIPNPQKWPRFDQPFKQQENNWENHVVEDDKSHFTVQDNKDDTPQTPDGEENELKRDAEDNKYDEDNNAHNGDLLMEDEKKVEEDMKDVIEYEERKRGEADHPANPGDDNEGGPPPNEDYGNNPVNGDNGDVGEDDKQPDNDNLGDNGKDDEDNENNLEDGIPRNNEDEADPRDGEMGGDNGMDGENDKHEGGEEDQDNKDGEDTDNQKEHPGLLDNGGDQLYKNDGGDYRVEKPGGDQAPLQAEGGQPANQVRQFENSPQFDAGINRNRREAAVFDSRNGNSDLDQINGFGRLSNGLRGIQPPPFPQGNLGQMDRDTMDASLRKFPNRFEQQSRNSERNFNPFPKRREQL